MASTRKHLFMNQSIHIWEGSAVSLESDMCSKAVTNQHVTQSVRVRKEGWFYAC